MSEEQIAHFERDLEINFSLVERGRRQLPRQRLQAARRVRRW